MWMKAALLILVAASTAAAQIQIRPTDPPLVTAANETWYQLREPIQFAGDLYYPAGAVVFFDGNVMARVGHYNGVPIYMDTTMEPYSVVLVPVRRGLLQPYERRRQGDMVGTTGSRTPSFPVAISTSGAGGPGVGQAAFAPTQPQLTIGAISVFTPEDQAPSPQVLPAPVPEAPRSVETSPGASRRQEPPVASVARPTSNDGIWLEFAGARWVSAGAAVPLRASEFRAAGEYQGFPVFVRPGQPDTIYLPTRAGMIAPYKRK